MPRRVSGAGKRARRFFTRQGDLRHIKRLRFWPLPDVLQEKYELPAAQVRLVGVRNYLFLHVLGRRHIQKPTATALLAAARRAAGDDLPAAQVSGLQFFRAASLRTCAAQHVSLENSQAFGETTQRCLKETFGMPLMTADIWAQRFVKAVQAECKLCITQ